MATTLIGALTVASLAIVVTACGASTPPSPAAQTSKAQATLAKYQQPITLIANDVKGVQIGMQNVVSFQGNSTTMLALAQAGTKAHDDLKAVTDNFLDNGPLFDAATELTASMGTLGDLVSNPSDPEIVAKFESQYQQASSDWNSAVDALASAAGQSGTALEVPAASPSS